MKYFIFSVFSLLFSTTVVKANIFQNHEWERDGFYLKTTQHGKIEIGGRIYDHSIEYTSPYGHTSSDMCQVSKNILNCLGNIKVTYEKEQKRALLSTNFDSYVYYEKGYLPTKSPITGTWVREFPDKVSYTKCKGKVDKLIVPFHEASVSIWNNVREEFLGGFNNNVTYYLIKDVKTEQLVLNTTPYNDKPYFYNFKLYDSENNPLFNQNELFGLSKLNDSKYEFYAFCNFVKL